jgi:HEAT repeat protein
MIGIWLIAAALAGPVEDLALAASKGAEESVRMEAFQRLVDLGSTDMSHVSSVSNDDEADARHRWVAIRTLGHIKGDRARNQLIALSSNPMPAIRSAAVAAMGDYAHEAFVPYLTERVQDPAVIVRAAASLALAECGDDRGVKALSDALLDKKNTFRGRSIWVRKYFVEALGDIGSTSAYPALLRAIDDPDEMVASAVLPALEKIAGFSYSEGRSSVQEKEAWRRHLNSELRR